MRKPPGRIWLGNDIWFRPAAMPAGSECARNRLATMGADPIRARRALLCLLVIIPEQSKRGVIRAIIENPQFGVSGSERNLAAQRRDVRIPDRRGNAMAIQDRFAMPDFVVGGMLEHFFHDQCGRSAFSKLRLFGSLPSANEEIEEAEDCETHENPNRMLAEVWHELFT
jgi:hypothetical protein